MIEPGRLTAKERQYRAFLALTVVLLLAAAIYIAEERLHRNFRPSPEDRTQRIPLYNLEAYVKPANHDLELSALENKLSSGQATPGDANAYVRMSMESRQAVVRSQTADRLAKERPDDPAIQYTQALFLLRGKRHDAADLALEAIIRRWPDYLMPYKDRVVALASAAKIDEALAAGEQGLKAVREKQQPLIEASVLGNMAMLLLQKKEIARARIYQKRALELHRNGGPARDIITDLAGLAAIAGNEGDLATSNALFQEAEAMALELEDPFVLVRLYNGWIQVTYSSGQADLMVELTQRCKQYMLPNIPMQDVPQ